MNTLTVTRDPNGLTETLPIPIPDIMFMEYDPSTGKIAVHAIEDSMDEVYYMSGTLRYWVETLNGSGFNFVKGDRTVVVNVDKVRMVNPLFKTAYFDSGSHFGCMLSNSGYKEMMSRIKTLHIQVAFA
ncbi:LytTR family transcriptional regulator DNA-binding domain-containing protein [Paenibacillus sp. CN-4]|uniref:LytTR family transcriptional regulator DNA-binding domain-containing protein n=1 Tax=Paenibacillus nanchangensis TaxID=3348343 RepID=UPI00397AC5CE